MRGKTYKILGENIRGECHDTGFVNDTNRYDIKSIDKKLKIDKLIIWELKFPGHKTNKQSIGWKATQWMGENILQVILSDKELIPRMLTNKPTTTTKKNSYKSITIRKYVRNIWRTICGTIKPIATARGNSIMEP